MKLLFLHGWQSTPGGLGHRLADPDEVADELWRAHAYKQAKPDSTLADKQSRD